MLKDGNFREYDIRGMYGSEIDTDAAWLIGKAFASLLRERNPAARTVSVGRDVRLSSPELAEGLIGGIVSSGLDVFDIGVCPTPLQYFSLFRLNLDGGIMVTGSHNPPEYNGFKISIGKETIYGDDIQTLRQIIRSGSSESRERKGEIKQYDIISDYREFMIREFSYLSGNAYRRLKIVVDAGNGTAGPVVPGILSMMGCEVVPLYCEPDGRFPNHHPDPTVPEYIQDLIRHTRETGADMGVGYDGDADRIGVIGRTGNIIWGDQVMIVLSRDILRENQGAKVIADVKCSQLLFDDVLRHGGVPVMGKTGHSLVKKRLREEGALLAGEFSGHIFLNDRYYGYDDALYTTFRLVEIMKKTFRDIDDLLSDIPKLFFTPEIRIDCSDETKKDIIDAVVGRFIAYRDRGGSEIPVRDVNTTDGVRMVFDHGWGLLRASNTQPVIVMRVEARDAQSLADYRAFLEKEVTWGGGNL